MVLESKHSGVFRRRVGPEPGCSRRGENLHGETRWYVPVPRTEGKLKNRRSCFRELVAHLRQNRTPITRGMGGAHY